MKNPVFDRKGFTLVELMVAIAVAGVVAAAMYAFQQSQVKSHVTQETVVNMHQNARAAMHFMVSEIRMAGCDPTGNADLDPGITNATSDSITFAMDFSGDGDKVIDFDGDGNDDYLIGDADGAADDAGEDLTYSMSGLNLVRTDNTESDPADEVVARNFDALDFVYYDEDGNSISNPNNRLDDIHSVAITLVARSGESVPGFMYKQTDNQSYENPEGETILPAQNDNFRRVKLSTRVRLRNAG